MDWLDDGDKVTSKEMKEEAIRRMEKNNFHSFIVSSFKEGKLTMSCEGKIVDVPEDKLKFIKKHEKDIGVMIYHVIHSYTNIGETYEYLYVSNYSDDWILERNLAARNIFYCYSENVTYPHQSEAGSILVENLNGSLLRIG